MMGKADRLAFERKALEERLDLLTRKIAALEMDRLTAASNAKFDLGEQIKDLSAEKDALERKLAEIYSTETRTPSAGGDTSDAPKSETNVEHLLTAKPTSLRSRPSPTAPQSPPFRDKNLADLRAKIEDLLHRTPALATELSGRGYGADDQPSRVANALVDSPAKRVAETLADVVELGREQNAARNLLWHVLPLTADWREFLLQARSTGDLAIELPLRTRTVAEIVLAGAGARCCLWAPGDVEPQGAMHVPLPAAAYAAFFDMQGEILTEAIFINLFQEREPHEDRLPSQDLWRELGRTYHRKAERKIAAIGEIAVGGRYLLVIDANLDAVPACDIDSSWQIAKTAIGKALPGLRLVRLKGGVEEMRNEYPLVPRVRAVRDRR